MTRRLLLLRCKDWSAIRGICFRVLLCSSGGPFGAEPRTAVRLWFFCIRRCFPPRFVSSRSRFSWTAFWAITLALVCFKRSYARGPLSCFGTQTTLLRIAWVHISFRSVLWLYFGARSPLCEVWLSGFPCLWRLFRWIVKAKWHY